MPTFEIVCLANSRKWHGRCVAGLRTDGKGWLRPVGSNPEGVLHPHHYMLPDDTEPQLGDVLRVHCSRPHPQPHHPEDWVVMSLPWERVSGAAESKRQEWLRGYLSPGPQLIGSAGDRVAADYVQAHPVARSLALVAPQSLHWHITANSNGERRTRVLFTLDGAEYNLSLTDPVWEQRVMHLKTGTHPRRMADIEEDAEVWLTISLGEPFAKSEGEQEFCYKLVAGVLVFTNVGMAQTGTTPNKESRRYKTAMPGRSKPTPVPATTYADAPDLTAYPDPFADDLPMVTVTKEFPFVTASAIPAAMLPSVVPENRQDTSAEQDTNAEAEVVPALPKNAPTQERSPRRQNRRRQNNPTGSADSDAASTSYGRTNGKWDNREDQRLWQKQMVRTRQTAMVSPLPWSEDEDALLLRLAADGETPEDIAAQVGRTLESVYSRLETLCLN